MTPPEITCKSCEGRISNREAIPNCVGCDESMHLRPDCVGVSEKAIYGPMEISQNVLTFCKDGVRNNQKEKVLYKIASHPDETVAHSVSEKVKQDMKDMEDKNDEKFSSDLTVVEEIGAQVTSIGSEIKTTTAHNELTTQNPKPNVKKKSSKDDYDGIRLHGSPESKSENARDCLEHDRREVDTLNFLQINCPITDLKPKGNLKKRRRELLWSN